MSELMSNAEIEDVLSSIRRLVSEDFRPTAKSAGGAVADKLILTPALRVVSDDAEPKVAPQAPMPRLHLGAAPEKVAATLEQAVGAQGFDWESEIGDPPPDGRAFEWSSSARSGRGSERHSVVDLRQDPQPDAERIDDAMPPEAWAQEDPDEAPYADMVSDDAILSEAHDSAWADETEAEVMALLVDSAPIDALASGEGFATVDEEALRKLVRDMIREELQGGLGERITRNVRKLVRSEISRALATGEFE